MATPKGDERAHRGVQTVEQVGRNALDVGELVEAGRANTAVRRAQELGRGEGSQRRVERARLDCKTHVSQASPERRGSLAHMQ